MDPIGIEENARANLDENEDKQNEKLAEIICSVRSLSRYEGRSFKTLWPQICAAGIAASFHIAVGISMAYSAILIPKLKINGTNYTDTMDPGVIRATLSETSWIASAIVIVAPFGGISGGLIMERYGRLNTIKIACIPNIIGWIIIATARNVPMLITGRVLTGFATCWGSSPAIVYITEIARVDMRGSLISFGPAYASLGMVLTFLKGWFLDWRTVAWMGLGYSIIPAILIQLIIPESPAWLVSKEKVNEAAESLKWIHRNQPQPEYKLESLAELQLQLLQQEHQLKLEDVTKNGSGSWMKIKQFFKPTGYKPLLILFGLFFFQQFSGIYITLFYSVTFFQETGSEVNAYLASTLIGIVRFAMSCVNTYMLRTFNRRPLIMISGLGMGLCMLLSGFFSKWIVEGSSTMTFIPTVLLLLYVITSMIGLLPIPWTMTAELFPIEIRGVAHSIAYSIANLVMFASIQLFYSLKDWCGGIVGIQWFFAVISVLASVYTFLFLPETHGKKLSEITNYFVNSGAFYHLNKKRSKVPPQKPSSRVPKKNIVRPNTKQNEKLINNV